MEISHCITECETVLISDCLESSILFCHTESLRWNLSFRSHTTLLLCRLERIVFRMWSSQNWWSWHLLSKARFSNASRNPKSCPGLPSSKQFFSSKDYWSFCNKGLRKLSVLRSHPLSTFLSPPSFFLSLFSPSPPIDHRPVTAFLLFLTGSFTQGRYPCVSCFPAALTKTG